MVEGSRPPHTWTCASPNLMSQSLSRRLQKGSHRKRLKTETAERPLCFPAAQAGSPGTLGKRGSGSGGAGLRRRPGRALGQGVPGRLRSAARASSAPSSAASFAPTLCNPFCSAGLTATDLEPRALS